MYVDLVGCETTLRVAADISSIAVVRLDQLSLPRHFTAPTLKLLQNTCSHKPCQYCLECINGPLRRAQGGSGAKQQKPWGSRPIAVHGPPPGRPAETYTGQIHVCRGDSCPYRSRTHAPPL